MEKIIFNTYKVASKIPLMHIASFFNLKLEAGWKEYIKLNKNHVEKVLKYSSEKVVYLYKFGCITFVGFNQDEIYMFLEYLKSSFIEVDSKLHFNESHEMIITDGYVKLWHGSKEQFKYNEAIIDVVANILAKSTEFNKIESELSSVLDEAGIFIKYLKKGRLRANTKKVVSTIAECTKFKYNTIESVRLLGRPPEFNNTIKTRKIFDIFSDYYELNERYDILTNRMNVLDTITEEYFDYRSNQSERRLILFEVFLLCLFPLIRLLNVLS